MQIINVAELKDEQRKHYINLLEEVYDSLVEANQEDMGLEGDIAQLADTIFFIAVDAIGGIDPSGERSYKVELSEYVMDVEVDIMPEGAIRLVVFTSLRHYLKG